MIEIGREKSSSLITRRLASAFGAMAALLLLVWLIRGPLSISQYSTDILATSFTLVLLSLAFNTRTRAGAARAVSSFLGNVAAGFIIIIILIWFLGWVDTVPKVVSDQIANLVILVIATGLLGFVAHAVAPRRHGVYATKPAILVPANSDVPAERTRLSAKADSIALPIARSGRVVGCVLYGDLRASFETPMGPVNVTFTGPMTTFGIPFRGERAGKDSVARLTGKSVEQLIQGARIDQAVSKEGSRGTIDLPFVHIDEDWFGESVDVGPIRIRKGPDGESVRIGSFEIDSDNDGPRHHKASWLARGVNDPSYLRASEGGTSAKWNGSSLWMQGDSMKLTVGADGFVYSPSEVKTFSPLHTLHVGKEKMTLDTRKFTLNVTENLVVFRTENGSKKSTDSPGLARDLRSVFTEEAKKHVQDVIKGVPIDLDEMLSATEEALGKYA